MTFSEKNSTITLSIFCVLLFAAPLHASWDTVVKAGNDKLYSAIDVSGSTVVMALICLPFAPRPSATSLPFLAVSTMLQITYTVLVTKTCQVSNMSQTYPLVRGTTSLLVTIINVLFLDDSLFALAWVGIATICLTILGVASNGHSSSRRGIVLVLINACLTAGYTLVDGTGVRLSETTLGYTLQAFFLNGSCLPGRAMTARHRKTSCYLVQQRKKGVLGGIGTMGSYDLTLWAMIQAPLAVVAALREISIPFSAPFAWLLLEGKVAGIRLVVAGGVVIGAVLLRLS